ncbi:MAG: ATP-binding protein [Actinomycetota bacterium]
MGGATAPTPAASLRLALTVPADAAHIGTIRSFASVVARHVALDEERSDDLKLAVSEGCADPMDAGVAGPIEVVITLEPDCLAVEIRSEQPVPAEPDPDNAEGLEPVRIDRLQLVRALFPDAQSTSSGEQRIVRFSTRSPGRDRV